MLCLCYGSSVEGALGHQHLCSFVICFVLVGGSSWSSPFLKLIIWAFVLWVIGGIRSLSSKLFVNFTKIMSENMDQLKKEAAFALAALMEIPFQYRATQSLPTVSREFVGGPTTRPLPPPREVIDHDNVVSSLPHMTTFKTDEPEPAAPVEMVCPICLTNPKDMAFGCGHTTCRDCGATISMCPMCRQTITTRLRLYT